MAAAGATISSCLSTRINSRHTPSSQLSFRIACPRTLQLPSISHSHFADSLSLTYIPSKWRNVRISVSVTQEEELAGVVGLEEEVVEEVVEGEVEAVVETEAVAETETETETETEDGATDEGVAEAEAEAVVGGEALVEGEGEVEPTTSTKLYFGNLPYNCDSAQLAGIIQDYGVPELVEVLYDRATGRSRGFAFVTMSSVEDCNNVIQNLDGSLYGGRPLRVNFADKPKPKEPLYDETEHKLFIGNLSWSVTSESLGEAFQPYGKVVGARVLYDGDTGRSRGYGFVSFSSKQEMDVALTALNGVELDGRAMRVSVAMGKRNY